MMDCMYDYRPEYPVKTKILDRCIICDENIYLGDEYYQFGDTAVCDEDYCIDEYIKEFRRIEC